ncbi:peptide-methionine (S)-S-oxide reductase MsrA [Kocuria rosea]|jgi:peptide-methionine (S)-S-oxide reductase|uniref:peptide-methionine (S)-S-oxide reductase MsrA n=1 Tax=Kocuria rosea TaxID=1275 RepID=UPI00203E9F49|nr:peptide-methionine (S)-S-oxide reductase MsrA [Kocuria rosea]MCM3689319.1 peptide-methionine (S)-S-oxide reductase MsrA [Kocuria rosea]
MVTDPDNARSGAPAQAPVPSSVTFVLAGGCFWCLDAVYRVTRGVSSVVSGYTGGALEHPSYRAVCSGRTGHAEAVAVTFDPDVVPEDVILDLFFTGHDPTSLNRQGHDVGTQYRSAMFWADEAQRALFQDAIARAQPSWDRPIVTTLEPLGAFWEAEPEHQDFYAKQPWSGYCQVVINPKLAKVRQRYSAWLTA